MLSLSRSALTSGAIYIAFVTLVRAHMALIAPSMYGRIRNPPGTGDLAGETINWPMAGRPFQDFWFHGSVFSSVPPFGPPTELPAGGQATFQIACGLQPTSFWQEGGYPSSTEVANGTFGDACPRSLGNYHSDPAGITDIPYYHHGCALAIADVDDISKATYNNMTVFSTKQNCVAGKVTSFDIPAQMPPCTGSKCICAFFWTQAEGPYNWYMNGFDCTVTGSPANAQPIATPQQPSWCDPNMVSQGASSTCVSGAKRPMIMYQSEFNNIINEPSMSIQQSQWYYRPGYNGNFSFPIDGAQNDIFQSPPRRGLLPPTTTAAPTTTTRRGLQAPTTVVKTVTATARTGLQPRKRAF